jgi:hypothetical protein
MLAFFRSPRRARVTLVAVVTRWRGATSIRPADQQGCHVTIQHRTAIFRQINKEVSTSHHDALEFPDGQIILLTFLHEGQQATVLQLPVTHQGVRGKA